VGKRIEVVPEGDGKTSCWKRAEGYRNNKPSQKFRRKKIVDINVFSGMMLCSRGGF
jgi:hypothetical protein